MHRIIVCTEFVSEYSRKSVSLVYYLFNVLNMQVVAGLKKFVKVEELEGTKVCVILNLKPAKLAGQVSEAMILAGSIMVDGGNEIVKVGSLFFFDAFWAIMGLSLLKYGP